MAIVMKVLGYGLLLAGFCAAGLASAGLFFFTLCALINQLRG